MPRFKPYSCHQTKLIPGDFARQLQPDTFEFAARHIIDDMDLSILDNRFLSDEAGTPAYDPAGLLKMVPFACSHGITSSMEIERACRGNVVFTALSADTQSHFTAIASFMSSMEREITPVSSIAPRRD